jgi:hypothetical protein
MHPTLHVRTEPNFIQPASDKPWPSYKEKGVRDCGKYVNAEYRFETLHGTFWMPDEQPDAVADLMLDWLSAHASAEPLHPSQERTGRRARVVASQVLLTRGPRCQRAFDDRHRTPVIPGSS